MNTTHILETNEKPVEAIRKFLAALWIETNLQGILALTFQDETAQIQHRLLQSPEELAALNPFLPFVPMNSAKIVTQFAAQHPTGRFGAILRPCEARALFYNARFSFKNRHRWLLIGVDCLASYPIQDLEWRTQKAGGMEPLVRETLRFARQGGIAPYRYRSACQMCIPTAPQYVDINISLIGLPIRRFILIEIKRKEIADRLRIASFTSGIAPYGLLIQHQAALSRLARSHDNTRTRLVNSLPTELPARPDELVAYLKNCTPCQKCLEACPIYAGELANQGNGEDVASLEARRWLASCVMCGQCEQACPRQLALTAIHGRISQMLAESLLAA